MALDLMGSISIELRSIGIRLLIIFFAGSEGKLDPKQVAVFERMLGFEAMTKQLSSHSHCCDDILLDGLFSLLFWQVESLAPNSRSLSASISKGNGDEG
jgi:hypothetical protein